jgi:hypothetical protein
MFGLTKNQLEVRNKDSLIKYIGALQTELAALYERRLEEHRRALDEACEETLKCQQSM